ncbi:MFS transporter [Reinekea sp.]|jgi:UMF1 family MFS transporter|uniref:MFS transporter n=1 Tax=Reinekea sp. TaxID=1970455 RepID=UPI002A7EF82B|nr:MFS transporter [Reinekea sp.]
MTRDAPALPVKKREILGWAMYDFANSSYTTVVVTFVYSAFFVNYIVPPELAHLKNTFWSIAVALSTTLAIILAPFVGVLCDFSGKKKKYLAWCTLASIVGTSGLFFVNPGQVGLGLLFLVISNTGWMLSESFIASFLPELASPKNMGKVSGIGWGIGYIGGLLSLLLMFRIITSSAQLHLAAYINENQLAMIFIALFYALGALPTFLLVKERAVAQPGFADADLTTLLKAGTGRILAMKSLVLEYPILFRFFIAFMVYSAGISVVVKFFGIYAQDEIGITGSDLVLIGATLQISSMVGAIGFGYLEDKLGSKGTILLSLAWWLLGIIGIYSLTPLAELFGLSQEHMFTVLAFIAGSALGATQSASRALVGLLAKPKDSALLFGLWGTFGRFAIIIGMTFGPISDLLGRHTALLFIMVYFIIGALMLMAVPIHQALRSTVSDL